MYGKETFSSPACGKVAIRGNGARQGGESTGRAFGQVVEGSLVGKTKHEKIRAFLIWTRQDLETITQRLDSGEIYATAEEVALDLRRVQHWVTAALGEINVA